MKIKSFISLAVQINVCLLMISSQSHSAVTVTPVINGSCLDVAPGPYKLMSQIIITEGNAADFGIQAGATLILTAPAGFEFNPGSGWVTFTSGLDINSASLSVTASTITVTLNVGTNTNMDVLRIRNIGVRALIPNISGNILRTLIGGTAVIAGDAPGAGVNHGQLTASGTGAVISSIAPGVWSDPTIWSAGVVPACTDNVEINHQVNADFAQSISDLTINSNGNLISDFAITVSGNFNMLGTAIYTHNNTVNSQISIFNGTENFAATSKIIVNNWGSYTNPLASGVTGDFGEIEINTTATWNQKGMFAPDRIKNTLTINSGILVMDNGIGMTTSLTLQDVVITGTGRLHVQTGTPRDLTLITGNFTDNSSHSSLSAIAFRAVGNIDWTVNGNLNISHRFSIIEGVDATDIGSLNLNVTGNFVLSGGTFDGMKKVTGPFTMTVAGNSTITGTPGTIMFKDFYTGDLEFNSGSLTINSNTSVYFLGTHNTIGSAEINIANNLTLSGSATRLHIIANILNSNSAILNVGNDLIIDNAKLYTSLSIGQVNVAIGRNFTQSGSASEFYGQRHTDNTGPTNINVNGSLSVSDGVYVQSRNLGDALLTVDEIVSVQNAGFYVMNNTAAGNNGIASLSCTDLNISGSTFYLHRGCIMDSRTIPVNITGELNIEFTNSSQMVFFISRGGDNNAMLDLSIGTNFIVSGSAEGLFCSSVSEGNETINIGGDLLIYAGRVRFNAYENFSARGHAVNGTINGSFVMGGGSISLSSNRGLTVWNINGDYEQTGGYAVYKWYNIGDVTITVNGNYILSNATATMYSRTATASSNPVSLIINGDASFDNCVFMFDSCVTSTATHRVVFQGSAVTFNENVVFDHAAHLSTRIYFGSIVYNRPGTIVVRRNSSSFDIRQTKQTITPGTTVDFSSSPFNMMIASHALSAAITNTTLTIDGTLNMGIRMIQGRDQSNYYSTVNVGTGGRLQTGHVNGLYSGSVANSCIYPLIDGSFRMNYFLHSNSTVEYNGTDTQIITGTGNGIATTTDHRYGNLEINFQGTPDVEFVYPDNDNIFVRTSLILTEGELNLDNDHITNTGGRTLNILNGATITRNNGYIRSETEDGSGAVQWNITTNGSFVFPFGYNSTDYVPFTYQSTAGVSGDVTLATYRTTPDNLPYPPTVNHVNDMTGLNNSANTVDRFWRILVPGNATANLLFSVSNSERGSISNPRAQLWEAVSNGWFPPAVGQSNPTVNTTQTSGTTGFNTWWTLAASGSPLPVELLSFDAKKSGNSVSLKWVTASEINNHFYTVERSSDGFEFVELEKIDGAGTTSSMSYYETYDHSPFTGINYYRLFQTDFDGTQSLSEVRSVTFTKDITVSIFPNPVISQVIYVATGNSTDVITAVNVLDLGGKIIFSHDEILKSEGYNSSEIQLSSKLASGSYILEVQTTTGVHRERIIKL